VNHEHRKLVLAVDNPFPQTFIKTPKETVSEDIMYGLDETSVFP
jgi:hypothetical protein